MADVSRTVEILFKGEDAVSPSIKNISSTFTEVATSSASASTGVDELTSELEELDVGIEAAEALGAAMVALAGYVGKQLLDRFVDVNVALDGFQSAMTLTTGSAAAASQEFEFITDLSLKLGVNLRDTAKSYSSFAVAVKGSSIEGEEARKVFEAVTGIMAATGKSASDTTAALRQLGQGISKGRFELEDLRGALSSTPGGLNAFAESIGVTTDELYEMVTAGEIGAEQIVTWAATIQKQVDGLSFDSLANEITRVSTGFDRLAKELGDLGYNKLLTEMADGLQRVANTTADGLNFIEETGAVDSLIDSLIRLINPTAGAGLLVELYDYLSGIGDTGAAESIADTGEELKEIEVTATRVNRELRNYTLEAAESQKAWEATRKTATEISKIEPYEKLTESAAKATVETDKVRTELEKIASNERIRNIDASVTLNVAQIEADAKIAITLMEGLANTITSTGDVLSSLFGNLAGAQNLRQEFAIEDQIKLENQRRQEALDIQNRQNEAMTKMLEERARAYRQGSAQIQVDGAGLQPHLEAFMFEILEAIQVKINADGYEYLLGAGV